MRLSISFSAFSFMLINCSKYTAQLVFYSNFGYFIIVCDVYWALGQLANKIRDPTKIYSENFSI